MIYSFIKRGCRSGQTGRTQNLKIWMLNLRSSVKIGGEILWLSAFEGSNPSPRMFAFRNERSASGLRNLAARECQTLVIVLAARMPAAEGEEHHSKSKSNIQFRLPFITRNRTARMRRTLVL